MLVLSRKLDEEVVIGGEIRVKVLAILGDKIRLGIDAPPEIPVHRHEIDELIAATNEPYRRDHLAPPCRCGGNAVVFQSHGGKVVIACERNSFSRDSACHQAVIESTRPAALVTWERRAK